MALLLFGIASRRRRRSLILAMGLLRLDRGTSTEQEPIDGHGSLSHHFFVLFCPYPVELTDSAIAGSAARLVLLAL